MPNISKIKEEIKKTKNSLHRMVNGVRAIFILFFVLIIGTGLFQYYCFSDNIIVHLPDSILIYEHFFQINKYPELKKIFADRLNKYFSIEDEAVQEKILNLMGNETAFALLKGKDNNHIPIIIIIPSSKKESGVLDKEFAKIFNASRLSDLIILSEKILPKNILDELLAQPRFQHRDKLLNFQQRTKSIATFYYTEYSVSENKNILDEAIIASIMPRQIIAGIKKNANGYELTMNNLQKNIISAEINDDFKNTSFLNDNVVLAGWGEIPKNIAMSWGLSRENAGIIIIENEEYLSELSPDLGKEYPHSRLMLTKNPRYRFILILSSDEKNKQFLSNIKTFAIGYLDKKIPEEKVVALPDGTLMTELWSNPDRFKFNTNVLNSSPDQKSGVCELPALSQAGQIQIASSCLPACLPIGEDAPTIPQYCLPAQADGSAHVNVKIKNRQESGLDNLFYLSNKKINFEFAYAKTSEQILFSNSKSTLEQHLTDTNAPRFSKQSKNKEFYISIVYLKDKSEIFRILSMLGKYAHGHVTDL